jgi:O-antigen/teichoic acid export membrane protein
VYYAGPKGSVQTALTLSESFHIVPTPLSADVLVLNGTIPNAESMAARIRSGAGLVLIPGPDLTAESVGVLLGTPVTLKKQSDALSLTAAEGMVDPSIGQIVWNSSPQIRERGILNGIDLTPIVVGHGDQSLILGKGEIGNGKIFYFSGFLNGSNPQIQDWPYFNYLFYQLTSRAAGVPALSFAAYPASPVPHARERNILFAVLAMILVTAWSIFWFVRRYSLAHPEALDNLVSKSDAFETRQATTDWEEVGFHRPLGGFLLALTIALIMAIPMTIYSTMILRVYILPSAQALGIYGRVTQFFSVIWVIFDVGTAVVFVKFFSQYRVHDPQRAIKFGQFFVWWQALTGTAQIALVTAFAGIWLPQTAYALYAWITIAHCMIQIPGFYMVFRHALAAWQRFDYVQMMELAGVLLFPLLTQPIIVTAMVAWGKAHPAIGSSMGGLYGMAISAYAGQILAFLLGFFLYRRLGYNAKVLFLAHFDFRTIRETFRFGVFEMLGSAAFTTGQAMEIMITTAYLVNYNEIWGNWGLAQGFAMTYAVLLTLNGNLLPSISEAISNARIKLSQYYAVMAHKWGGFISGFFCAVLLAVVDRFILGTTGPEFERAAAYAFPLIIYHAMTFPTWANDIVILAANRPYLKMGLTMGEQMIRIGLIFALIDRFQIYALVLAYMVAIMVKNISSFYIAHRYCFPQRYYLWQTLVAPLLSGLVHYYLLRWSTGLIWTGDPMTSLLVYIIGLLFSFPLYAIFYGFFGGWDDDGLLEFKRAVSISNFVRPIAWILWKSSDMGARISPIHGRFPISIYQEAIEEASSLTKERVDIA